MQPCSNFDALRLFACALLVYGNGLVLTGAPGAGLWGAPLPRIGLDLLFAISGYLAVGSLDRAGRLAPYLTRRALRLYPGLVVSVLVTLFVIGPLATRLSLRFYFLNRLTVRYLLNIVPFRHLWLPGVFEGQQWNGAVNGMLWTLVPGALCWLALPFLERTGTPLLAIGACAVLSAALSLVYPLLGGLSEYVPGAADSLTEIPFFLGAAWLALLARRTGPAVWRADLAVLCFAANWIVATWLGSWNIVLEWVTLPYMACCFGREVMPGLGRIGVIGKPAYGMFLYAFPVQQLIVARMPGASHPILTCFVVALALGLLSWHLVEQPALRWGGRLRRGLAPLLRTAP